MITLQSARPTGSAAADGGSGLGSWFAHRSVTLREGQTATVDLVLAKVPTLHQPAGQVVFESKPFSTSLHEHYRMGKFGWASWAGGPYGPGREYEVADLRSFGLTLCVEAFESRGFYTKAMQCGAPVDKPTLLNLRSPPDFSTPARGTPARFGMAFAWSAVPNAAYQLVLSVSHPAAATPVIRIYTTGTTGKWPDLHAMGIAFPTALIVYEATIAAIGPYATMDDLVGPEGRGAILPKERWSATSNPLDVPVIPPLGKGEASCKWDETIICGNVAGNVEQSQEWYQLSAMNNKIRYYPQFANAIAIHCVRDCKGARAFSKAYQQYAAAHPGFDADEPLDRGPPPPPPPLRPPTNVP